MSQPVQERDGIATGKIILTAVVSLLVFGIGVLWSVSIERTEQEGRVAAKVLSPTEVGKPEIGIVYQTPFFLSHFGQNKLDAKRSELEQYGWVDKNAKVVHIPIEAAMKKYVASAGGQK